MKSSQISANPRSEFELASSYRKCRRKNIQQKYNKKSQTKRKKRKNRKNKQSPDRKLTFRLRIRPQNAGIWPEKPKGKTERKRERKQKSNRYFIQEFEIQNKIKFYICV